MRGVCAAILIAGFLSAEITSQQQQPSTFGGDHKAAIEKLFDGYAVAFRTEDYAGLRQYLQAPFIRFGPSNTRTEGAAVDWVVTSTIDETIDFFRQGQKTLKALGVERFEWGQTRITALSADRAIVNKSYRRYRKDGTLVMEAASWYVVTRSSGAWKIAGILNQDPREFGKVY